MSTTAFPSDKETGEVPPSPIEKPAKIENENDDSPSTRQTIFLLSLLWISWFIGAVFDTVLEIDRSLWSYERLSPLQQYVFSRKLDAKFYKLLDSYYILTPQVMQKVAVACFTMFVVLFFAISRAMPITDCVTAICVNLLGTTFFSIGAFLGADEKEAVIMAMPPGLLIGYAVVAYMRRVGKNDFDARVGLSGKAAKWCHAASFSTLVVAYACFYGLANDLMILFVLYEGVKVVYVWLG